VAVDGVHPELLSGRKQRNLQRICRNTPSTCKNAWPVSSQLSCRYAYCQTVEFMTDQGRAGNYQGSFSGVKGDRYVVAQGLARSIRF
jgi:hypothetical protein